MSAPGPVRAADITRDDWETPPALFEALDQEFHFTLDAAANEQNHKCERWLSGPCEGGPECGCGLCARWEGVVWLNPPYGRGLNVWITKCADSAADGATVVALLPANTDTDWFALLWGWAAEIRFLRKRVQFVGTTSSNPGGSMVAVFRPALSPLHLPRPIVGLWSWR
jgi:site-specific DNA-methyltransferase (adenine-specific)